MQYGINEVKSNLVNTESLLSALIFLHLKIEMHDTIPASIKYSTELII
jgi:hypothetical protein